MKRVAGHGGDLEEAASSTRRQCIHRHGGDRVDRVFKEKMEITMAGAPSEGERGIGEVTELATGTILPE